MTDETTTLYELTPKIHDQCFRLCKQYLNGFRDCADKDFQVEAINKGFTNQLFRCWPSGNSVSSNDGQSEEVVVLFYGQKYFNRFIIDENDRLSDVVVGLIMSQKKIGPEIYGVFANGFIMKYYEHRNLSAKEHEDRHLIRELARILARIHGTSVPLKKKNNCLVDTIDKFYAAISDDYVSIDHLIEETNCKTLQNYNLKDEVDWVKTVILNLNSPLVFCHNDFRGMNIMVIEEYGRTTGTVKVCDFEYSSYNFRGFDFGHLFAEWGQSYSNDIWKFRQPLQNFPHDSVLNVFVEQYIRESIEILGESFENNDRNSAQQISKEIKTFTAIDNLWTALFFLQNKKDFPDYDQSFRMPVTESYYKNYIHLKQKFISENIFD